MPLLIDSPVTAAWLFSTEGHVVTDAAYHGLLSDKALGRYGMRNIFTATKGMVLLAPVGGRFKSTIPVPPRPSGACSQAQAHLELAQRTPIVTLDDAIMRILY